MTIFIRPYHPTDFDALYQLWQAALGGTWPLTPDYLREMLTGHSRYAAGDHLIAEQSGQVVGFAATEIDASGKDGKIPLFMVRPENQRQGIGRQLHDSAMTQLRQKGVEVFNLGHGPFWPGVPLNLSGAVDFFKACGWQFPDINYDLTNDLSHYQTPAGVLKRVTDKGIQMRLATPDEVPAILDFEQRNFPFWIEPFQITAKTNPANILAAWEGTAVVGTLLLEAGNVKTLNWSALWHKLLGENMGTIGAVGVEEIRQGKGIGLALVAKASDILREQGVGNCHIGWTDLVDFYGKLGYTVWQSYGMTDV